MILMNNRRTIYINIAFFAILIIVYLVINFRGNDSNSAQLISFESAGMDLPLTPLQSNGKAHSMKDYRGKPILLHFWASWCEPCAQDRKPLNELSALAENRNLQILEIASEDTVEAIRKAGKLDDYPGDNYIDSSGNLARALSVKSYPYTLLIDKDGRVIFREEGPLTGEDIQHLKEEIPTIAASAVPAFDYANASGGKLSSNALQDKVWVADFIFTSCGDTCPLISEKLRVLQEEFGHNPEFRMVSFSIDPGHDSLERLRQFGEQHRAQSAVWSFLRPSTEALRDLMVHGFHLGTTDNPTVHTAKIVVINKGNLIDEYIDGESPEAVAKLKTKIRTLLSQK